MTRDELERKILSRFYYNLRLDNEITIQSKLWIAKMLKWAIDLAYNIGKENGEKKE